MCMGKFTSTKVIELGSCAFRQWRATHSHCQFVHGYQLKAKIWFSADSLDDRNWIVDFGGLKPIREILRDMYDHKLVVAQDDPLLEVFKEMHAAGACDLRIAPAVGAERTAEEVFKTVNTWIKNETNDRCRVTKVEVYEHEYNSAIYEEEVIQIHLPEFATPLDDSNDAGEPEFHPDPAPQHNPRAAPVGNKVTGGKGGWFEGTSWG